LVSIDRPDHESGLLSFFCSDHEGGIGLSCSVQLLTFLTRTRVIQLSRVGRVATLAADEPATWSAEHGAELVSKNAVRTAHDLLSRFESPSFLLPSGPEQLCGPALSAVVPYVSQRRLSRLAYRALLLQDPSSP
jgi:hypothetical protein